MSDSPGLTLVRLGNILTWIVTGRRTQLHVEEASVTDLRAASLPVDVRSFQAQDFTGM
jgi:hypothetical protein